MIPAMSDSLIFWVLTFVAALSGLHEMKGLIRHIRIGFSRSIEVESLRRASAQLRVVEERISAGMVLSESEWSAIDGFPSPWARILRLSLADLKAQGAPLLPTLSRMRKTLQDEVEFILESKVKSAQAVSQAGLAVALIPAFAGILYGALPGVKENGSSFLLLGMVSFLISSFAFLQIHSLSESARYGKVRIPHRPWWILIQATLERILALISSGSPPDLAWRRALSELYRSDPGLATLWGVQVWDPFESPETKPNGDCERIMMSLGVELRRSIQTSLIEGRGCLDRLDSIHQASMVELRMKVRHELNLLPNQCLKPLFVFVFPGVLLLLGGGLWFSFQEMIP
jgi:hypothetical protein